MNDESRVSGGGEYTITANVMAVPTVATATAPAAPQPKPHTPPPPDAKNPASSPLSAPHPPHAVSPSNLSTPPPPSSPPPAKAHSPHPAPFAADCQAFPRAASPPSARASHRGISLSPAAPPPE